MKKPVLVALTRGVFSYAARQAVGAYACSAIHCSVVELTVQMADRLALVGLDAELAVTVEGELLGILAEVPHEKPDAAAACEICEA